MRRRALYFWYHFSFVRKISIIMLCLATLSITGMSISEQTSTAIQGNAHMINRVGAMRMQSYRILALNATDRSIQKLERELTTPSFKSFILHEKFEKPYQDTIHLWHQTIKPQLSKEHSTATKLKAVEQFVTQLNVLVSKIDAHTEQQILTISVTQKIFMGLTILFLILAFMGLHRRLFTPWRQLLQMANAMRNGNFVQRFESKKYRDEMAELGGALNSMAHELELMYSDLEQRVQQKTIKLKQQNEYLDFLYRSGRAFNSHYLDSDTLKSLFNELLTLSDLHRITFYPSDCLGYLISDHLDCQRNKWEVSAFPSQQWAIGDHAQLYGTLITYRRSRTFSQEEQQLMETFGDLLSQYLSLLIQDQHRHQLLILEERHTIARELHDSIAQSLSYLKIKSGILRMNSANFNNEQHQILQEISQEINSAYTQLRELLITFRLKLDDTKLSQAILNSINEYNQKLGFPIKLNNQWPEHAIQPHQAIHVLQIIREALSNIYKHAKASKVKVKLTCADDRHCYLTIADNGVGLPTGANTHLNHYGLTTIADRVKSLSGTLNIHSAPDTGTVISISFCSQIKE